MNKVQFEEGFFNIIIYTYIFFYLQCLLELGQAGIEV